MFYSQEEFEAQMAELTAKGYADDVAYDIVRQREEDAAASVQDRKTGEFYNPQEAFDAMMNKPEILAVFKRLAVR
jgi:hypothetical protein